MDSSSDESVGFEASVLDAATTLVDEKLDEGEVDGGRQRFFEGVQALQANHPEEATRKFRRAARKAEAPFDDLARVARAECERVRGNIGVALREWGAVAEADGAPTPVRYVAWLSIAAAAEARDDERLFERARRAVEDLERSGER